MLKCAVNYFLPAFLITVCAVSVNGCSPLNSSIAATVDGATAPDESGISSKPEVSAEKGNADVVREAGFAPAESEDNPDDGIAAARKEDIPLDTAMDLVEAAQDYWNDGDTERSIEALDQAYALIASSSGVGSVQGREDLRFLIAKRILEIHASRHTAAKGSHRAISLAINKHVEREIELFRNKEREFFLNAYRRSGMFRGDIMKAFKEAGLPEELSWLPLIESGFSVKALSRSRALGLWQFIPSTGYKFGLQRTNWVDERMDPGKSTAAAVAYLNELYSIFRDWPTVLLAYNCGEGAVLSAIRKHKIDYLDNFWDLYEKLPEEGARFYPRFLGALAILREPARYDFVLGPPDAAPDFEIVTVQKRLHLKSIADELSVSPEDLYALNPELRRNATPASIYALKVPAGKGRTLLAALDKMQAWTPPQREFVVHRVRRGENLSLLALKYRTNVRAIQDLNRLTRNQVIRAGQRLKIPARGT